MKKKVIVLAVMAALMLALALPALAADDNPAMTWFKQRMEAKKAYVNQAVQNGQLTREQADAYNNHFDEMIQYHEQNGFNCPNPGLLGNGQGGKMGAGQGQGKMGFGNGGGKGMGGGMRGACPMWQGTQSSQ